jgi:nickel-dependent lactate racemase
MPESARIRLPFGRGHLEVSVPAENLIGVLQPQTSSGAAETPKDLILHALDHPAASSRLEELAAGKKTIVVITSDHTRAMPSRQTLPLLLERVRSVNPSIDVTILIATGSHRAMTQPELLERFGEDILCKENILQHRADDMKSLLQVGILPSGSELWINRAAAQADLLIAEGLIEPHFFAGFSGGRKSILPGIAGLSSIMENHCAEFLRCDQARTGNLEGNPIHLEMLAAVKLAKLAFILNVVLGPHGEILLAVAGEPQAAHQQGVDFIQKWFTVPRVEGDIVITSNGGYPLDQNIYQSVKGMSTAESCCSQDGVIVMVAACQDGHGGESFFHTMSSVIQPAELYRQICCVSRQRTVPDQWESQILSRILSHHTVILVTPFCDPDNVKAMHLEHAQTLEEAMERAFQIKGRSARVVVIPDGVATIVRNTPLEQSGSQGAKVHDYRRLH